MKRNFFFEKSNPVNPVNPVILSRVFVLPGGKGERLGQDYRIGQD
ncbi:MAG: hypothetical protein ACP5SH_10810 [Syntrophobacteraceae bacterium]